MNARIAELAEQAGLEYNFDSMTWLKYEKFAELIVQECAEYVRHWNYAAIRNDMEYGVSSDEILEYFGVKQ